MTDEERILNALRRVQHPEMARDLVHLGMVKEISSDDEKVRVTLALPFKEIPIRYELMTSVRLGVTSLAPSSVWRLSWSR